MEHSPDVFSRLAVELRRLVQPLEWAGSDEDARRDLLAALGWELDAIPGFPAADLGGAVAGIVAAAAALAEAAADPPEGLEDLAERADDVAALVAAIGALSELAQDPELDVPAAARAALGQLGEDLFHFLATEYLWRHHPLVYHAGRLLTLVRAPVDAVALVPPVAGSGDTVLRHPSAPPRLRLDRLAPLLSDPVGVLRGEYLGTGGLATEASARQAATRLFGRLAPLLATAGARISDGTDYPGADERDAARTLAFDFPVPVGEALARLGAIVEVMSDAEGGAGLAVRPAGVAETAWGAREWTFSLKAGAVPAELVLRRTGVVLPAQTPEVSLRLAVERRALEGDAAVVVGAPGGTRLELGRVLLAGGVEGSATGLDADVELLLEKCAVVVEAGDGDGFLRAVLPREGIRAGFDLGIGWSRKHGLRFRGGAGLEAELPTRASLFGALTLESTYLGLKAEGAALRSAVAATFTLRLGPLTAVVERFGLAGELTFPPQGGNLGPAQLALGVKLPSGIGLALEAGPVKGGGFLFADPDGGQYAGALQLEFEALALKAVGLLTTRMPDGSPGFSLLILISAEFTPIQLGYGFTLNGVGGLLGVNRTAAVEVLRAGVRDRTLDAVMFPRDPVANAANVVRTLARAFPAAPGRFVFGPMARLGWGTPTLLTLDVGLILDLPSPVRLIALGRLRLVLPDERAPVVRIHMDVLGVIDFERGEASIDATLYDSEVAGFALSGDMAMRARWGRSPTFALSAGGFNPRFQPPPGFPALRRMAIALATGNNPRLRLEAYLALTSNTVQFGARLDLYATALGFSIEGMLAFDALVQFDPFGFIVDIAGQVALKRGSKTLMGIRVTVELSGPRPWHAKGKARFEVLFVKGTVSFDVTIGRALPRPPPAPVDVALALAGALGDARNWAALPPAGEALVTLRRLSPAPGELLVHPLGALGFDQRVVPLNRAISRYGNAPVLHPGPFRVASITYGGETVEPDDVRTTRQHFAPAQFFDLTDDEKLSRPSFEEMDAGQRLPAPGRAFDTGELDPVPLDYEMILVDDPDAPGRRLAREPLAAADLARLARTGAAGTAPARTGGARFTAEPIAVSTRDTRYVVAGLEAPAVTRRGARAAAAEPAPEPVTYGEAAEAADAARAASPAARRRVRVRAAVGGAR